MRRGWVNVTNWIEEAEGGQIWQLYYLDAEGTYMVHGLGFTRTANAAPFTHEYVESKKREVEAEVLAQGGTLL